MTTSTHTVLAAALLLAGNVARAQVEVPAGDESVYVDTALLPSFTARIDANGTRVPGGVRLGWWGNLASRSYVDGKVRIVTSFRADLDSAATAHERAAFSFLEPARAALLSAWVDYDASPTVSLRLGRQFYADTADFLAFDGVRASYVVPETPIRIEAYTGLRTSFAIPTGTVGSALYGLDGVASTEGLQPLYGLAARYVGNLLKRQEASIGFRQSWRLGAADPALDQGVTEGPFVTAEEAVAAGASDVGPVHVSGGVAYSTALGRLVRARVGVVADHAKLTGNPDAPDLTYALDYQRYKPAFALDSIWNWFSMEAFDDFAVSAVWRRDGGTRIEARGYVRLFHSTTTDGGGNDLTISPGTQPAGGGRAGVVHRMGGMQLDGWVGAQAGYGGRRLLVDGGASVPATEAITLHARVTGTSYAPDLRPAAASESLGVVAGLSMRLPAGASVSLLVEETLNVYATPVPRVFGVVDFARWL